MSDINKNHMKFTTKTAKERMKSELKYRSLTFFAFMLFLLVSVSSQAADCLHYFQSGEGSQGTYSVYYHVPVQTVETCTGQVVMNASEYAVLKHQADEYNYVEEITPASITESFLWGFGTYITFWWLSYCIRVARKTIKVI